MTVDDTELDTFGMGKRFDFMQQYVSFKDLLTFRSNLDSDVSVMTCMDGQQTKHRLSLIRSGIAADLREVFATSTSRILMRQPRTMNGLAD